MTATDTLLAEAPGAVARPPSRLESIDLLRGVVMVLMVLDHTRDFFGPLRIDPTDLSQTSPVLFATRWVTHLCAPIFIFLAGTGAYLAGARGKSRRDLAYFLVTRGLWLLVLELTVVRFGLSFSFGLQFFPLLVFWSIGVSMIALAGLMFLPLRAIALVGLVMVFGHNLLDGIAPQTFGRLGWVWNLLHVPGQLRPVRGMTVFVAYPLIPWIGVMACGYAIGPVFLDDSGRRKRLLLGLGAAMVLGFIALRFSNAYGDPRPWSVERSPVFTLLSFLNCSKYPPSLLYLLMTLGPALLFLGAVDGLQRRSWNTPLLTFGRVPLFFYLLQWPLLHASAIVVAWAAGQPYRWLLGHGPFDAPGDYGHGLGFTYVAWIAAIVVLYVPCAWFAGVKQRRRDAWLSYL